MKRLVANKILIITLLALFIFASFSVIMITYLNNKMVGENIKHFSTMYASKVEKVGIDVDINTEEGYMSITPHLKNIVREVHIDSFRVTIANIDGSVLADNGEAGESVSLNIAAEKGFSEAQNSDSETYIRSSDYYSDKIICSYKYVLNSEYDEAFVVRVEMALNYDSSYFIMIVLIIPLALLIVMLGSYLAVKGLLEESVNPLLGIHRNLIDLSNGEYNKYEVKTKYREIQRIVDEVNTVGIKIAQSFKFLNYEREKSRFILDNMNQGIMAISPEGTLLIMNRSCKELLGSSEALLGENLSQMIPDKSLLDMITKAIEVSEDLIFEYEVSPEKIYSIELQQVEENWFDDKLGKITLVTFNDVTAESLSAEIRSEFFANASHELRTPLTAIKGFSELLSMASGDELSTKCSSEISKNTDKMLGLISDMLEISKMDAKLDYENLTIIDLTKVAAEVINKIESIAIGKNVTVSLTGSGEVVGVDNYLEELLTNLIDNAIKYNKEGGKVDVSIVTNTKGVTLTVEDNGIGIANRHQARIFERFYRVDKGRDRRVESSGLGLAIVKNIVNLHRAKIGMSSKVGVGTKFIITFPSAQNFDSVFINKGNE